MKLHLGGNLFAPVCIRELSADRLIVEQDISPADPVFEGHYPHIKVFPGVLLLECMEKLFRVYARRQLGKACELEAVESLRFFSALKPGETILIIGKRVEEKSGLFLVNLEIFRDSKVCAKARLTFRAVKHDA